MSNNGIQTLPLLEAIVTAITEAWGSLTIFYEAPATIQPLPYAIIDWQDVGISFTGEIASATYPGQDNNFLIIGRFPYPTDPSQQVPLLKIQKANLAIAQLQTGSTFAGIAAKPLVTGVNPEDYNVQGESAYTISLTFNCQTRAPHH